MLLLRWRCGEHVVGAVAPVISVESLDVAVPVAHGDGGERRSAGEEGPRYVPHRLVELPQWKKPESARRKKTTGKEEEERRRTWGFCSPAAAGV